MKDIIVIVGPTGVGKTKLSVELAKRLNAEIINGDSVAIYKKLDIGSAKPSLEERGEIPHHLLDIKDVLEDYSVYDYQKDIRSKIEEINKKGKRVIVVGGTGLYLKAAFYDYRFTKETIKRDYSKYSLEELVKKIESYDVVIPDIHNRRRVERLLQKLEDDEEISNHKDVLLYPVNVIGLTCDRELLYKRINRRVDDMLSQGLLKEVESLKEYYKDSRVLNSAIGYKEFVPFLFEQMPLNDVVDTIKQNSRRFAKRQYTFFNHQFDTKWFDVDFDHFDKTIDTVEKYINKKEL